MRKVWICAIAMIWLAVAPAGFSAEEAQSDEAMPMPAALAKRARADLCGLVIAALSSDDSKPVCSGLREKNGDLIMDVVLADGDREVGIMRRGLILPRFRGHPKTRDDAQGVIHGEAKEKSV